VCDKYWELFKQMQVSATGIIVRRGMYTLYIEYTTVVEYTKVALQPHYRGPGPSTLG
jgi:hypothetical protein